MRTATQEDIIRFYGRRPHGTIRALTVWLGGEPVAVGGVYLHGRFYVAFSDIKQGVSVPAITVWRHALRIMQLIRQHRLPVYASASENFPNAGKMLMRLGFVPVEGEPKGAVYLWQN